jgi:ABC-type uncharacterized transport system ATPase subunit
MNSVLKQASLHLRDLEIAGFRTFRRLRLANLGRVNLIVGRNNVGKSSVLEALQLYADGGASSTIRDLLQTRDLLDAGSRPARDGIERLEQAVEQLFHRREGDAGSAMRIGPLADLGPALKIERVLLNIGMDPEQQTIFEPGTSALTAEPGIRVMVGEERAILVPLSRFDASYRWRGWKKLAPSVFVSATDLFSASAGDLWDNIALTNAEEWVLDALRVIAPEVERLSFIQDQEGYERIPVVKISGARRPVPLRTLGDGMTRLLEISLALVNASRGFLLIDEVENGIHYAAHAGVWEMIFKIASELDVQVFATTHSWDAILAFQSVANADSANEGVLHRLERNGDAEVKAVPFSEAELGIAARHEIEVR